MSVSDVSAAIDFSGNEILELSCLLARIDVAPRCLFLDTPGTLATVPMLRGAWGAALHDLDRSVYDLVFAPDADGGSLRSPGYVLRPAAPDPLVNPAVEWILFADALQHDTILCKAWEIAMLGGLGPYRKPFSMRNCWGITVDGQRVDKAVRWTLADPCWPLSGDPASTPVRLRFQAPLRLIRKGKLIFQPALPDIVVAVGRRAGLFLPWELKARWDLLVRSLLEFSRSVPSRQWRGARLDFHRYSGRQKSELDLHGVAGYLDLPEGPGKVWPLLSVARWLHIGKGSVMGLGHLELEPL